MAEKDQPIVTQIAYDGIFVKVWWSASADKGVTGYQINVMYDPKTVAFSTTVKGRETIFGSLPLDSGQLDSNIAYFVQVTTIWKNGPGQNEDSQFVPLITRLPEIQTVYYDGTDLYFEWTPTPQAVQGYVLTVTAKDGGTPYAVNITSPNATRGVIPASALKQGGLDKTVQWQASVRALGNIGSNADQGMQVSGSSPLINLPDPLPDIQPSGGSYQSGIGLTAKWTPVSGSGITRYRLLITNTLSNAQYAIDTPDATTREGVVQFPQDLSADQHYQFRLIALNAEGGGMASAASAIIPVLPRITAVDYDAAAKKVNMIWAPCANPALSGYTLEVFSVTGTSHRYTQSIASPDTLSGAVTIPGDGLPTNQFWAARITAVGANKTIPGIGSPLPVLVVAPVLNTINCDGTNAVVNWNPIRGKQTSLPEGYIVNLLDGTTVSASTTVMGGATSSATLSVPDPAKHYSVQITSYLGVSVGPVSATIAMLNQAPQITKATTDRISNILTLNWQAVDGAAHYFINFSDGRAAVNVTAASYPFPDPLTDNVDLSVTVRPQAVTNGVTVNGPMSQPFKLPSNEMKVFRIHFNGLAASISWHLMDGVSGYTAAVLEKKGETTTEVNKKTVPATRRRAVINFTADADATYQIVVQARFGKSSGPASPPRALFKDALFPSTSPATSCYPFVYAATDLAQVMQADTAKSGIPITLYLPDIGAGTALTGLPFTVGAFTLAAYTGAGKENYPYTLSISNTVDTNNPWKFDTRPIRSAIQEDYVNFLKGTETHGVTNWGIIQLQQNIARALPQTFAELLYYNYGLNFQGSTVKGSADLRPGMVLRVCNNPFQTVAGQNANSWFNGYVGGPVIDYDIGSLLNPDGSWGVGFDTFIGQLVANGALSVDPPAANSANGMEQGIADAADLYFPAFRGSFYRLFVPSKLISASSVGSIQSADNFVLAAADSYTALTTASNTPGDNLNVAYFRGRALLKLCIRINLNDEETVVPIGTTLGDLLERSHHLPPATNVPLKGIKLKRALNPIVLDPGAAIHVDQHYEIRLDWKNMPIYGPNWDVLAMPVLAGDKIILRP